MLSSVTKRSIASWVRPPCITGTSSVQASSGPAISGVKLREGLQHAADHPGDVLGSAAQYVRELGRDKSSVEASSGPAIEPVKLKKTAIESWKLKKGSPDAADPGDLAGDKSSVQASSEPAIEPVKLKKTAIESWKLKKGLQDAADPGDVLNNAAQYVRDLGRDKTSAKADSFFDAMEARARRELAYWRSTVRGVASYHPRWSLAVSPAPAPTQVTRDSTKPGRLMEQTLNLRVFQGAVGVFQHYFGVIKDISLNGFTVAETKLHGEHRPTYVLTVGSLCGA